MSKEFCDKAIDCLVNFSNCYRNSRVRNKLSIEWTKVTYFTFERVWKHYVSLYAQSKKIGLDTLLQNIYS